MGASIKNAIKQIREIWTIRASQKQKAIVDNAVEKYAVQLQNGRKAVIASENIIGGAYALGYDYFASA